MKWSLTHAKHGNKPWAVQAEAMKQREASGRNKYGYFLEQGLGKTSLTLNDFAYSDAEKCIVVCPNSFKADWALAPEEWGRDDIRASIWSNKTGHDRRPGKELLAVNYESARRGMESYNKIMTCIEERPSMVVIDESSCIKNHESENAKSIIELAKRAKHVRLLNGTPLTQNVLDYYPQLRCLGELNGMVPVQFRNKFAVMGGYMGRQVIGINNETELYDILKRCSFRALKTDWRKDLPPQIDVKVHLEMTTKQRIHYEEMMEEFLTIIDDMTVSADMVLTQYDKLRQISSCVAMQNKNLRSIEEPKDNPKVKACHDIINSGTGKVIIVYTYRPSGETLVKAFEKLNPAWMRGQMKPSEITAEKDRFNNDPACRVLVAQQASTCMGHTLLGGPGLDRCTRMIFYEFSFSLRDYLQMRDRNHRGEQDQDCTYFGLVTSPMDELVVDVLTNKKSLSDSIDAVVKAVRERKF